MILLDTAHTLLYSTPSMSCIKITEVAPGYLETKMGNIMPLHRPINYGASGHLLDVMAKLFRPPTELGYVNQGRRVAYQNVLIFYTLRGT